MIVVVVIIGAHVVIVCGMWWLFYVGWGGGCSVLVACGEVDTVCIPWVLRICLIMNVYMYVV